MFQRVMEKAILGVSLLASLFAGQMANGTEVISSEKTQHAQTTHKVNRRPGDGCVDDAFGFTFV